MAQSALDMAMLLLFRVLKKVTQSVAHSLLSILFFSARLSVRTVSFNLAVGAFDDFA